MALKRWLIGNPEQSLRNSFIWNATASMINALQSTFILFVIQRIASEYVSGIFTISFATANLILLVGKFGVRSFQVSDIQHQYSYSDYVLHRIMTVGAMMVVTVAYCLFAYRCQSFTAEKT